MTVEPGTFACNQWCVVASSMELPSGRPRQTELFCQPIVVERSSEGRVAVHALDAAGERGRALPCEERYGYIWASIGKPEKPLMAMPEFDEPGRRLVVCGVITVRTSGPRIIENFLDMAHFPYVHPGVLGSEDNTEVAAYKVEQRRESDELWATDCGFKQPQAMAGSAGEAEVEYLYRVAEPFSSVLYKSSPGKAGAFDLIGILVQPRDETLSDVHCFMLVYDDDSSDEYLVQWQQSIFLQDRVILENQRPLRLPLDARAEKPIRADSMSVAYRKWLRDHGLDFGVVPVQTGQS